MQSVSPRVSLLAHTPNALDVIYTAYRQCYSADDAKDIWAKSIANQIKEESKSLLVSSTMDSGHHSPLEHVTFTFALAGISRSLTHQLVRHRIGSYSQQSQRYVNAEDFNFVIPPHIEKIPSAKRRFEEFTAQAACAYEDLKRALEREGHETVAKEEARAVLPNATETKIVVSMNCRALISFFNQRCCQRAQAEIREVADQMLDLCRNALPVVFADQGPKCVLLGYCPEGAKFSCGMFPTKN